MSEPVSIYICTKRTVPLTKAFLSHGDSFVPPRQPFTEIALSGDCSEKFLKLRFYYHSVICGFCTLSMTHTVGGFTGLL